MESSAYYKEVIDDITKKKIELETKKANYQEIKIILKKLSSALTKPIENMQSAERNFENGGYYVGGQTPGNGALKKSVKKLINAQEDLEIIIKKTSKDISEFEIEIQRLEQQLTTAVSNYRIALKS